MDTSSLLLITMATPLVACLLIVVLPLKLPRAVFEAIHVVSIAVTFLASLFIVASVFGGAGSVEVIDVWFQVDALSAVFLGLVSTVVLLTGLCSVSYIRFDSREGRLDASQVKRFYAFFSLFVFTMLLVVTSNNVIMMWVAIEATTLSTVFLVGSYNTKISLEAAWKYLIVCTAGVAFGLYGTLLVYANAADIMADPHQAVFWTSLVPYAAQFDSALIRIAFVFAAIGFGTKAGLFPMHTWMPDAYSQAPSPLSGLMSGALAKCAMLVLIRFYILAVQAVGPEFPQTVMLILGAASIVFSAFALFSQSDLKRKLAYSSCENIGIVALCLGFGGPLGIAAALLHCIFHGLAKALMFCLSGNVAMRFKTSNLEKISGIVQVAPVTAVLLGAGLFALSGFPPFALFLSEVLTVISGIYAGYLWLVIPICLALTVVIAAFSLVFLRSVLGKAPDSVKKKDVGALMIVPEMVFIALLLWFGIALPAPVISGVGSATAIVMQEDASHLYEIPVLGEVLYAADAATQPIE